MQRPTSLLVVLVAFLVSSSCRTTDSGQTPGGPVVGVVADCAKESVGKTALDHLSEVEGALLVKNWRDQLLSIAVQIGEEALSCIIDHIINQSTLDVRASSDANARLKVERGNDWLKERQVTFSRRAQ